MCLTVPELHLPAQACTGLARRERIALALIRFGRGQAQRVHFVGRQCCSFAPCSGSIPQARLRSKRVEVGRAAARAVEAFGCHPVLSTRRTAAKTAAQLADSVRVQHPCATSIRHQCSHSLSWSFESSMYGGVERSRMEIGLCRWHCARCGHAAENFPLNSRSTQPIPYGRGYAGRGRLGG